MGGKVAERSSGECIATEIHLQTRTQSGPQWGADRLGTLIPGLYALVLNPLACRIVTAPSAEAGYGAASGIQQNQQMATVIPALSTCVSRMTQGMQNR